MTRRPCTATTTQGRACRAFAPDGGELCRVHDPARADEVRAARSKGGRLCALQGRRRRLDNPAAVVAFLSNLVYDVAEGRQDAETAKTLSYALSVQLKALDLARGSDLDRLRDELRAELAELRRRRA